MKTYLDILEEFGWPRIYLVPDRQFYQIEGDGLYRDKYGRRFATGEYSGIAAEKAPIIALRHNLRGKVLKSTIYHELLHPLEPYWKHWKIECAAELLAGGGGRGYYSQMYGHTPKDLHMTRDELLTLVRRRVVRFNKHQSWRIRASR